MESVRIHFPGDLVWQPMIEGADMAILHGDPTECGEPYVIRFRTNREIYVPLHWHREDEHVTLLAGPFSLDFGSSQQPIAPGAYVVIPAGVRHRAWYGAGTVIQVSGIGPFESIYVEPQTGPA
jgi:hypothetical protein